MIDFYTLLPQHIKDSDHSEAYRISCSLLNERYRIALEKIQYLVNSKSPWKAQSNELVANSFALGIKNLGVFPEGNRAMVTEAAGHLRRIKGTKESLEVILHALGVRSRVIPLWSSYALPYPHYPESPVNDNYFSSSSDLPYVVDGKLNPAVDALVGSNTTWRVRMFVPGGSRIIPVETQSTKKALVGQKFIVENHNAEFEVEKYESGFIYLTTPLPSSLNLSLDTRVFSFYPSRVYASSFFDVVALNGEEDLEELKRQVHILSYWTPLRSRLRKVIPYEPDVAPTLYESYQEYTAECAEGSSGPSVTKMGYGTSFLSQEEADQNALQNAMNLANSELVCTPDAPVPPSPAKLMFLSDCGDSTSEEFNLLASFLSEEEFDAILVAGNLNLPSGDRSTASINLVPFESALESQKLWFTYGNRDMDFDSLQFSGSMTLREFQGQWRWTSTDVFNSGWREDWSVSNGWGTVTGGIAGFGQPDNGTGNITGDVGNTYYFVSQFGSFAPLPTQKIKLRMIIDDAARVFINGTKVYDFNTAYPVSDSSTAIEEMRSAAGVGVWTQRTVHEILVDASVLIEGQNILAAEVRQDVNDSPDLAWDCMIEIGSGASVVPSVVGDLNYTYGIAQPLRDRAFYIPNGAHFYHKEIGEVDLFVLNSGVDTSGRLTSPYGNTVNSLMHSWFVDALSASTKPFKVVMFHHPYVGFHPSYVTAMDWPEFKQPGFVLINGHSGQTVHLSHSSGMNLLNASRVVDSNPIQSLGGNLSGFTSEYVSNSEAVYGVLTCASETKLEVRFHKLSDHSVVHSFDIDL